MEVIIKPLITEKMTAQAESLRRYGFVVDKRANKLQIKSAVEKLYDVSVKSVGTMNYGGKAKTRQTKTGIQKGKTNAFKKAIITVVEGDVIDFYSNI